MWTLKLYLKDKKRKANTERSICLREKVIETGVQVWADAYVCKHAMELVCVFVATGMLQKGQKQTVTRRKAEIRTDWDKEGHLVHDKFPYSPPVDIS